MTNQLSIEENRRYARHFVLPGFGQAGQERLRNASVLVVGAGGLGSPALLYLAAAGVGRITIVDADVVDVSNLQRQVVHTTQAVGRAKALSAADTLRAINPHITIQSVCEELSAANAHQLIGSHDCVVDGCDNFATRYLTNDFCFWHQKPLVYASIQHFEGQCTVFAPHLAPETGCYRCLVPNAPSPGSVPTCAEGGVLGVLPGIVGSLQAAEAIKLLAGMGTPLLGRLWHGDVLSMQFREFKLRKDPACVLCGAAASLRSTSPPDYAEFCSQVCASPPPMPAMPTMPAMPPELPAEVPSYPKEIPAAAFLARWKENRTRMAVLDVRERWETEIAVFPGARVVPLGTLKTAEIPFPQDVTVYTVCKADYRSQEAAAVLRQRGWPAACVIAGGMDALSDLDDDFMPY